MHDGGVVIGRFDRPVGGVQTVGHHGDRRPGLCAQGCRGRLAHRVERDPPAISGVLQGSAYGGNRKAAGRQCTVTVDREAQLQTDPHAGGGERRPDAGVHVHHVEIAAPQRLLDGPGGHRVVGDLRRDRDPEAVHRNRERLETFIRRGSGVAVITSGCRPISCCRRVRSLTCISIPPSRGTKQSEMCAIRTVPPASPMPFCCRPRCGATSEPCDMLARCRTRSSSSTPIPTTRRCSPPAPWPSSSAQGHRVVLVVATAGEAGLAADELTRRRPARGSAARANCEALGGRARGAAGWRCSVTPTPGSPRRRRHPAGRAGCPGSSTPTSTPPAERLARDPGRRERERADDLRRERRLRAPGPHRRAPDRGGSGPAGRHPGGAGGDGAAGSTAGRRRGGEPGAAAVPGGSIWRPGSPPTRARGDHPLHRRQAARPRSAGPRCGRMPARPPRTAARERWGSSPASRRRLFGWVFGREWYRQSGLAAGEPGVGKRFTGVFDTLPTDTR